MLRLRAAILITLGTPVMAGLLVGSLTLTLRMWGTALLDVGFWLGASIACALSLTALGIILRARARVLRDGERHLTAWLARLSPALMLLGALGGAAAAHLIAESTLEVHRGFIAEECRLYVGEGRPIEACLPVMERCDGEVRGTKGIEVDRRGRLSVAWPEGLARSEEPKTRARLLCAWRAQRGE